ncbi:MAG: hypothetical protein Q9167_007794 [Letrouitia subvulpina]
MAYIVAFQRHRYETAKDSTLKAATKYSWIAIKYQLHRLSNHHELFPDAKTREDFFISIGHQLHSLSRIVSNQKSSTDSSALLHENIARHYNESIWPAFDQNRKAWQQWLHLRAPGSGISREFMDTHNPSVQILPWAVHYIIGQMGGENAYLKEELAISETGEVPDQPVEIEGRWMRGTTRPGYKSTLQGNIRLIRGGMARDAPAIRTSVNRNFPSSVNAENRIDSLKELNLIFDDMNTALEFPLRLPLQGRRDNALSLFIQDQEPRKR